MITIHAGHVGRFRGRRLDGEGRGLALAGILTGWLVLFVCVLANLAALGLAVGIALFVDSV
ncbi:hypothetical protein AB0C98_31185 [Streptomyces sp. NPDC048558]|uniref:hypothetical protein n=1 Tax=Streptomyces sp. NPDC048558 TaxID=3155759 RepID=UPI003443862F